MQLKKNAVVYSENTLELPLKPVTTLKHKHGASVIIFVFFMEDNTQYLPLAQYC